MSHEINHPFQRGILTSWKPPKIHGFHWVFPRPGGMPTTSHKAFVGKSREFSCSILRTRRIGCFGWFGSVSLGKTEGETHGILIHEKPIKSMNIHEMVLIFTNSRAFRHFLDVSAKHPTWGSDWGQTPRDSIHYWISRGFHSFNCWRLLQEMGLP